MSAAVDINVLYENLEEMGVEVFDCPLSQFSAVAEPAGYLGLNPSQISSVEQEREILIHEEGHFATNTFYQLDSPYTVRQHQENLAARHGIKKYFSVEKLLSLMEQGYTESWQLAEQLGVRPAYIQEMLDYYTQAQGVNFSWELKKRRPRAGNTGGAGGRPAYRGYPPRTVAVYRHRKRHHRKRSTADAQHHSSHERQAQGRPAVRSISI